MRRRPQATVEVVFEACGTTTDDERWIASGWRDCQLSRAGRRQAHELGERCSDVELAAVFTSDLARAAETARIAFGGRALPVFHDWRLRECGFGELGGGPVARLEEVRASHVYDPFPGGESYVDVVARVRSFLHDLAPRFADRTVVVVGHHGTKLALDHVLEGVPLADLFALPFRWQPGWLYTLRVDV